MSPFVYSIMWRYYILTILVLKINAECPPATLFYPCKCVQTIPSLTDKYFSDSTNVTTYGRSISCENIPTTLNIQFEHNPYLSTIHPEAFTKMNAEYVRVFETSNTNLSETIFKTVLSKFVNLLKITMLNDSIQHIPSYAFHQSKLEQIWFGIEGIGQQPLEWIDSYAFYHLNSLGFLRIFSDNLSRLDYNSFAFKPTDWNLKLDTLFLHIGGRQLSSKSFPLTSLSQFGGRHVFLRFYDTPNLKYLDETIFQPFLESDESKSIIDVHWSQGIILEIEPTCPCEMYWIQRDYFHPTDLTLFDNRVYRYPCWDYDFSSCQSRKNT